MLFQIIDAIRSFPRRFFTDLEIAPTVTLSDIEHRQLSVLAMAGMGHDSSASDRLYWELDRARVVPVSELAEGIVTARLVHPELADDRYDVSILSPLGTALIGVAAGSSIPWSFGREGTGTLTLLSVNGP